MHITVLLCKLLPRTNEKIESAVKFSSHDHMVSCLYCKYAILNLCRGLDILILFFYDRSHVHLPSTRSRAVCGNECMYNVYVLDILQVVLHKGF